MTVENLMVRLRRVVEWNLFWWDFTMLDLPSFDTAEDAEGGRLP